MARVGAMRSLASARLSLSWSSLKVASLAFLRQRSYSASVPLRLLRTMAEWRVH